MLQKARVVRVTPDVPLGSNTSPWRPEARTFNLRSSCNAHARWLPSTTAKKIAPVAHAVTIGMQSGTVLVSTPLPMYDLTVLATVGLCCFLCVYFASKTNSSTGMSNLN